MKSAIQTQALRNAGACNPMSRFDDFAHKKATLMMINASITNSMMAN